MKNNETMKTLKKGENVYILEEKDGTISYVQAVVTNIGMPCDDYTTVPYILDDSNNKTHVIYYPITKNNEEVLTLYEFVERLLSNQEQITQKIDELKKVFDKTEYLIQSLKKTCGKNGFDHVYGDWIETDGFNGNISGTVTDEGVNYHFCFDKEWYRTCKCCGQSEYTSIMPPELKNLRRLGK